MALDWGSSPVLFVYTVGHVLAVVLTVALTGYIARNYWQKPIGRLFTALVASTSIGVVGTIGRLFTTSIDGFVAVTVLKYVGIGTAPIFFLFVALIYDRDPDWITRRTIALALAVPVVTLVAIGTMPTHELFYTEFSTATVGSLTAITAPAVGPWYWTILVYDWVAIAVGTVVLLSAAFEQVRFFRNQLVFLLLAVLVSWTANVSYAVFSWPHPVLDPTAIGFAVADLFLASGIFVTRMIDTTPAARSLVLDAIDDAVVVVDPEDRVIDINDAARSLIGSDSAVGEPATEALPTAIVESSGTEPQTDEEPTTVTVETDSGERYLRHRQLAVGPDGTRGRAIVLTDVTDEVESQRAIEQAHRKLRQIVDLVPDPLYVKNRNDEVLLSNEANAELHGLTPEEIEGMREREIESDVENIENFDRYRQREIDVMDRGDSMTFEETLTGPDGERYTFQTTRIPFEAAGRDEDAVLGYARDVTDRKEYERELEVLNRILRHDVHNDIVVLSRFGEKLERHVDEEGEEYRNQLLQRAEHIRDLTDRLRTLMRTMQDGQRELRPIRLDTVLETQIREVREIDENAVVTVADGIPQVSVRADQMLSSVFYNVLQNAVQHNDSDVPKVTVAVEERPTRVEVRIEDNGPGIPDDLRDDIFGEGERGLQSDGTGIGLYLVDKLLDEYDGDIEVTDGTESESVNVEQESEDDETRGATFTIELDRVEA
jgi:PAS domain S-box-containing protein